MLWMTLPALLTLPSLWYLWKSVTAVDFDPRRHWDAMAVMLLPPVAVWLLVLYGRWTA
jgi:hypothetical protein